ncbi:VanZ family protein [Radiobacillus kanasensis]|uniref:VanZ family protein n=1 Tax=Radiobacillus kanasensis TaxID=2844358 RepID=UPI001E346CF0|nr:VanZ family protein [Radiobacillus kanasensis]UFT98566.1 VanZ family protein [Radiobacillus kanasensis]
MKKYLTWLLPISVMAIIFYSSHQPYEDQDIKPLLGEWLDFSFLIPFVDEISFVYHHSEVSTAALGIHGFIEFFIRKGAHVTIFCLLMLAFYIALSKTYRTSYWLPLFLTVIYAISDEFHQSLTPNRTPYVGDVILDTIGTSIGVLLISMVRKRKRSKLF